jgi:Zn-dependent M28 family amino/carboxypeptidase
LKTLSSDKFLGRKIATQGSKLTQQYIKNTLVSDGVTAFENNYIHPFTKVELFTKINGANVIGIIKGSKYPKKYLVLSAHFDHLGGKGNNIYNGTDDNASGTAALLIFAKKIQAAPLDHSVIVLFTDGEEAGLYGSKAFVKQNKNLLANIKLNINIDMISGYKQTRSLHYIDKGLSTLIGKEAYQNFKRYKTAAIKIKSGFKQTGRVSLMVGRKSSYISASDHGIFNKKRIPFVYYGVGVHPNYHTKKDDFAHANLDFFIKATDFIYQNLLFFDQVMQHKN